MEESTDKRTKKIAKHGRPRIEESISEAILRIRKETGWGYTKIVQAMRRLGHHISRQTVKNILIEAGLGPQPHDYPDTWCDFIKSMQQHCGNVTLHARRSGPSKAWSTSTSWCSFTSEVDESGSLPARNILTHNGRLSKRGTLQSTLLKRNFLARFSGAITTRNMWRRSTLCLKHGLRSQADHAHVTQPTSSRGTSYSDDQA